VALVAVSGIGAPAALAGDAADPAAPMPAEAAPAQPPTAGTTAGESPAPTAPAPADPAASEATPTDAGPSDPATTDAGPSDPATTGPGPSDPETTGPGPSDPGPSGSVASDAGPVDPGPAPVDSPPDSSGASPRDAPASTTPSPTTSPEISEDAASAPGPAQDSASRDLQQQSHAGDPPPTGETQQVVAVAHNRSLVFQVVWQVQLGCRTHCRGTSQSQLVIQRASTTQSANATVGGAEPGAPGSYPAEAYNASLTVQFVWQLQIGCVAFCYETSQTQSALQWAETIQTAIAEGGLAAVALSLSQTLQYVLQIQQACEYECYGVFQSQTSSQAQATTQSATAKAHAPVTTLIRGPDGVIVLPGWLVALAENHGATIQTILQYQEALCLNYCDDDVQLQEAIQEALSSQDAIAVALVAPVKFEELPVEQPSVDQSPAAQPADEHPQTETPALSQAETSTDSPHTGSPGLVSPPHGRRLSAAGRSRQTVAGRARDRRSIAPALPVAGGSQSPPPSPPAVGKAASKSPTSTSAAALASPSALANHTQQPPFNFALALEPVSPDDAPNWRTIAMLVVALALLTLLVAFARRSSFLRR
jgi:hypothetical protein